MSLLYIPPSLRHFDALPGASGEAGGAYEAPLVYDLVEALRPRIAVDLGVGSGGAFFALCQSMRDHDVDGLAYGVDEWPEETRGEAGPSTPPVQVNNPVHTHFRGIGYLLCVSPDAALRHFPEGSAQFLRVDAARLGGPLRSTLSGYGPRVAEGGVILVTGLSAENGTLEEWKAFEDDRGVLVEPRGGESAMGFLRLPPSRPASKESDLLAMASGTKEDRVALGAFYAHACRHHALRREVRDMPGLFRKKA